MKGKPSVNEIKITEGGILKQQDMTYLFCLMKEVPTSLL